MANNSKAEGRKKALKEFLIGAGVAAAGGIISLISYNTAKPGETYTVYTGIIALGAVYAIHGLYRMAFPTGLKKSDKSASAEAVIEEKAAEDDEEDKIAE